MCPARYFILTLNTVIRHPEYDWGQLLNLAPPVTGNWHYVFSLPPYVHDCNTAYETVNFTCLDANSLTVLSIPKSTSLWSIFGVSVVTVPRLCWAFPSCPYFTAHCQDGWVIYSQTCFPVMHHQPPLPSKSECLHCTSHLPTLTPLQSPDHRLITVHLRSSLFVYPNAYLPWSTDVLLGSHKGSEFVLLNNTLVQSPMQPG